MGRTVLAGVVMAAAVLVMASALTAPVAAQETTMLLGNEAENAVQDQESSSDEPEQSVQQGGQQTGSDAGEEDDAQTTIRASGPLQGAETSIEKESGAKADRIEIDVADCTVSDAATVTMRDGDRREIFATTTAADTDEGDVEATIAPVGDQLVVNVADDTKLRTRFGAGDVEVTGSTGIACGRDGGDEADKERNGNDLDDDFTDLSCAELLVLFRAGGTGQYGDTSDFDDVDVRARIEVCLKREIVQGTAADEDLPDTGGFSLIGLAVFGVVTVAAGLSLVRRRPEE